MEENIEEKIICNFSSALRICFALFSMFKTDQDTKTSKMKFLNIMKMRACNVHRVCRRNVQGMNEINM